MIAVTLGLIILIALIDIYFEVNFPKVNKIKIKSSKPIPKEDLKILQITDYHNFESNNRVLKLAEEAESDIIVITGDLIDRTTKDYNNVYGFIEKLVKINPKIFFVSGNHEFGSGRMNEFLGELEKRKINIINNSNKVIEINGQKVNICGLDYSSSRLYDLDKALNGIDKDLYTVLLSHRPDITINHTNISADLILAGHTHGGQVRIPFIGAALAPGQGALPKYDKGLFKLQGESLLYIDSGVGTTRLPIRFLNRSQVSLILIQG